MIANVLFVRQIVKPKIGPFWCLFAFWRNQVVVLNLNEKLLCSTWVCIFWTMQKNQNQIGGPSEFQWIQAGWSQVESNERRHWILCQNLLLTSAMDEVNCISCHFSAHKVIWRQKYCNRSKSVEISRNQSKSVEIGRSFQKSRENVFFSMFWPEKKNFWQTMVFCRKTKKHTFSIEFDKKKCK